MPCLRVLNGSSFSTFGSINPWSICPSPCLSPWHRSPRFQPGPGFLLLSPSSSEWLAYHSIPGQPNPKLPGHHRCSHSQRLPLHPEAVRHVQEAPWGKGTFAPFPRHKGVGWAMGFLFSVPMILLGQRPEPLCQATCPNMEVGICPNSSTALSFPLESLQHQQPVHLLAVVAASSSPLLPLPPVLNMTYGTFATLGQAVCLHCPR